MFFKVRVLTVDFKHFDAAARARVAEAIAEMSVGVLVCTCNRDPLQSVSK